MIDKLKAFFKVEPQEEGKKESFADRIKQLRDKCLDLIKKLDKQAQAIYIGLIVAMIILAPWLVGFFTMISLALEGQYSLSFAASQSAGQYMIIGLFPGLGLASTIFVYILGLGVMMLTIIIRSPDLSPISETDERGVNFAVDGTYGTAKWMSKDEAKKVFCVGDIRDATGYILG